MKVLIKGTNNLIRDTKNHAIINTDKNELKQILVNRNKRKQNDQDLQNLKTEFKEIKSMMKLILERI